MDRTELIGTVWIAATTTPWAISPHPNFSVRRASGPELIALVSDFRFSDFHRYREEALIQPGWEQQLIDGARDSVIEGRQVKAAKTLAALAAGPSIPLGARAAAALFASVALSENDEPEAAVELLTRLLEDLAVTEVAERFHGSLRLTEALLRVQRSVRMLEAGWLSDAMEDVEAVPDLLERLAAKGLATFNTSKGVSWGARQVQMDLAAALRSNALSIKARLEGLEGRTWTKVVKSRPDWPSVRAGWRASEGTQAFVGEAFEKKVAGLRKTRRFSFGDSVMDPTSAALFAAELSGDTAKIRRQRETLAQLRVLRPDADADWAIAEALRLLRQCDAKDPLEATLRYVRAQGPNDALHRAARTILRRTSFPDRVGRSDVAVLAASSDLLSQHDLRAAIGGVNSYLTGTREGGLATDRLTQWARHDEAWRAVRQLLPGSLLDSDVADAAISYLEGSSDIAEPLVSTLAGLSGVIEWSRVPERTTDRWRTWAQRASADDDSLLFREVVLDAIDGAHATKTFLPRPTGLRLGARLYNELSEGAVADSDELAAAERSCREAMREIREGAKHGRYAFGGVNAGEVAAALCVAFEREGLWEPLAEYLLDGRVASHDKAPALERLARAPGTVPEPVRQQLREAGTSLLQPGVETFGSPPLPIMPSALRAGMALSIFTWQQAISSITQLAGLERVDAKVEAARSACFARPESGAMDAVGILLLQLSHDYDPVVRGEAARSLGVVLNDLDDIRDTAVKRLSELLSADGILIPLSTLRGLGAVANAHHEFPSILASSVQELSTAHPARVVKIVAGEVAQQLRG